MTIERTRDAGPREQWHPPMTTRHQRDTFAYDLRQTGMTYQRIGERMGESRERARMRIARHEALLRRRGDARRD